MKVRCNAINILISSNLKLVLSVELSDIACSLTCMGCVSSQRLKHCVLSLPTSFVAQALVAATGNEVLAHFDVPESGSIMKSRVAVIILNVGVKLVLFQKNRSELVVPPIRGLVKRASSAASFKSVHIGFGRKALDL